MSLLGRDRTAVYPWFAAVGLGLGWLVSVALGPGWTDAAGNVVGNDFLAFWSAADLAVTRPGADPYDPGVLAAHQHALLPELSGSAGVPFLNPPLALFWFLPFAMLGYGPALFAWWALGVLAWVAGHAALREVVPGLRVWSVGQLLLAGVLFVPTLQWVFYGQATGLILGLLAVSLALLSRGRELAGGAVLGLLAFKPQVALGLALPLLVRRRWAALLGGVISVSVQGAFSAWLWPELWVAFFDARSFIAEVVVRPDYKSWGVVSVYGFWHLALGGGRLADLLTAASTVGVLGALIHLWWRRPWDPRSPGWWWAIGATFTAGTTLGMQNYLYDLGLLLLPFWIAVGVLGCRPGTDPALDAGPLLRWAAALWVLCFVGPYVSAASMAASEAVLGVPLALQILVPVLLLAAWQMARRAQSR